METLFSWIHLADLHFGHGDAAYQNEQKLVLRTLAEDIPKQVAEIGKSMARENWRPDALIISGDVAFSAGVHSSDEYSDAKRWLIGVADAIGIAHNDILIVPGNHDIQRLARLHDPDAYRLLQLLRTGEEKLDEVLALPVDRERMIKRIAAFLRFAEQINPIHVGLGSKDHSFCWIKEFAKPNICTQVVGFNTALLCNDDRDMKNLEMGSGPLAAVIAGASPSRRKIVVAITHHPFDWLRDEESAKRWITNHAQVHLCGHIHDQKAESFRSGGADPFLRVVAGASHNDTTLPGIGSHGYNIGLLLASDAGISARIWPRTWVDQRKSFGVDPANVKDPWKYSEHSLAVAFPFGVDSTPVLSTGSKVSTPRSLALGILDLAPTQVDELRVPDTDLYSSFCPATNQFRRIEVPTTSGFVLPLKTDVVKHHEQWVEVENEVYVVRDPVRPFEIQIGGRRASRPGGDPGTVPLVDGLTAESLQIMYPMLVDESLTWLRMIFADLSTSAAVLNEIYHKDPDLTVRQMAARNPSASGNLKATECPFCNPDFLQTRTKRFESSPSDPSGKQNSKIWLKFRNKAAIFCNDYPYGPFFHYIVMPTPAIHSWEDITEEHLQNMNLLIHEFFEEDPARLKGTSGIRIGLNSTIRHLVMGKSHRSSAGASVAHVHKQIWGMLPGSINLGDHLRRICHSFGAQMPPVDYLELYVDALRAADFVLWKDPDDLVTLYVPFGQISVHELQIIVNRRGVGNYLQLGPKEILALSRAEYIVTRLYQKMGIQSFNEVLLTQPFDADEPFVRLILTFITREIDIAVSELNLLYVVDKKPEDSRDEIRKNLDAVLAELEPK